MNSYFHEAFNYAKKYSTCLKVYVGACFVTNDGRKFFSCNRGEETNCQKEGKCHKAEVTGIYESCEETRKYCASVHSEINMINILKENNVNPADGTMYVTRYPCLNCMTEMAKAGFKKIYFCGKSEGTDPESNKKLAEEYGIEYEHFPKYDFESEDDNKWWTKVLHDKAYDIVKDRKFPILIPSYNNPNPPAVKGFLANMDEEFNYPIIIFVRESQYDEYVEANKHPYVTVVGFKDDLIIGAGNARRWSLKWLYDHGYHHAFSFDDDALGIGMTEKGYTGKGDLKSQAIKDTNISKVLAAWQLSMEELEKRYNNLVLTGVYPIGFSWKPEYCWSDQSALLYRGNLNQVVCLNVKNLIENGITYKDNKECGHEDIQLILESLEKDMLVATFPFIWYSVPPMDVANFSDFGTTMKDRFHAQQQLMKNNWENCPWVTFREKRDLDQVNINFRRYRKDKNISNYVIDIWNNGNLLK